jgi:NAD-reducing hydrogenase small subunit
MSEKIRLATVWLDGCSGCHMSLLDTDERLIDLARRVTVVWGPLVDHKEFPENVDVTLVEGAISSEEDLHRIRMVRARTKILVSLGDCAVTGNVPAMRNQTAVRKLLDRIYIEGAHENRGIPAEGLPTLLRQAVPVQEVVKVDLSIPGCPPAPKSIAYVLTELIDGRVPDLSSKVKFG